MEILTVCDRFKFGICNAQTVTVDPHLSPVVNIINWWGFWSQVTGQSSYVLTPLFYLVRLAFSITEKSAVQCDQTVILEGKGHDDVLLKFQWYWMKTTWRSPRPCQITHSSFAFWRRRMTAFVLTKNSYWAGLDKAFFLCSWFDAGSQSCDSRWQCLGEKSIG